MSLRPIPKRDTVPRKKMVELTVPNKIKPFSSDLNEKV